MTAVGKGVHPEITRKWGGEDTVSGSLRSPPKIQQVGVCGWRRYSGGLPRLGATGQWPSHRRRHRRRLRLRRRRRWRPRRPRPPHRGHAPGGRCARQLRQWRRVGDGRGGGRRRRADRRVRAVADKLRGWHGAFRGLLSAVPAAQLVTFRWRRACRLRGQSAGSSLHSEAAEQVYFKKAHRVFWKC